MPSVRVKRERSSQYASLRDIYRPEDASRRPRSRSVAQPSECDPPAASSQFAEQVNQSHPRQRSYTVASRGSQPTPRPPSKIYNHIMSSPRIEFTRPLDDPRSRKDENQTSGREQQSEHSEMISLHGSQENVMYRGGRRPGRIGSALGGSDIGDVDEEDHHHDDIVEHLDVIDPAVATVSTLANAANAMVFPPLSFYSRRPTIVLPGVPGRTNTLNQSETGLIHEDDLDRHVEDVLGRRDKFRRIMHGVWSFMKTPMGILVSIYGFLVVFWGAGIVLFLAKMINLHNSNTQGFWVELCQQIETGLFSATSIGLIPFRVLDTWRMCWIYHWQRVTLKRRRKAALPDLYDNDDLPDPEYDSNYIHVLTQKEQADLHYQQHKFMESQTWYRPHGTFTHRAFPIHLALWICVLNDLNSFFQCLLSGCMWSMDRFQRPAWTTATTLPAAFVAGILAGVFIWWGGKKSRRHEQVENRLRAALAMEKPPVIDTERPSSEVTPSMHPDEQLPEIYTTDSAPTMMRGTARSRGDRWDNNGLQRESIAEVQFERIGSGEEKGSVRHRESVGSFGSVNVNIADRMTVPPAEDVHPESFTPWS